MTRETFEAGIAYEGERLDKYLNLIFSETDAAQSRSFFQKLIKEGHVLVNDTAQKANYRLKADDMICVEIPDAVQTPILPENIPLDILYEDDDLLVVNKPKGMVVHPSAGHYTGTLVMPSCITAGTVCPASTGRSARASYTASIWIQRVH